MRVVVQLVKQASVSVDKKVISEIKKGYLILLWVLKTKILKKISIG